MPLAIGSFAAWIHSLIGNVIAGSWFAILQSLGATCAGFFTILTKMAGWAFGLGMGAVVIASALFGFFRGSG